MVEISCAASVNQAIGVSKQTFGVGRGGGIKKNSQVQMAYGWGSPQCAFLTGGLRVFSPLSQSYIHCCQ